MYFYITCSNCGKRRRLNSNRPALAVEIIKKGWGSCGSALYCPDCKKTWRERNDKPMSTDVNTIHVLYEIASREALHRIEVKYG